MIPTALKITESYLLAFQQLYPDTSFLNSLRKPLGSLVVQSLSSTSSHFPELRGLQLTVTDVSAQTNPTLITKVPNLYAHPSCPPGFTIPELLTSGFGNTPHVSTAISSAVLNIGVGNLPSLRYNTTHSDYNGFSAGGSGRQDESRVSYFWELRKHQATNSCMIYSDNSSAKSGNENSKAPGRDTRPQTEVRGTMLF